MDFFEKHPIDVQTSNGFNIIQTTNDKQKTALVSSDVKVCDNCLKDINTTKKYHNYFATNCTNCGPRYSIIRTVPYDRKNSSMDKFIMCASCKDEYTNPSNRRYHAQPISCNDCGPQLTLVNNKNETIDNENIYKKVSNWRD